MAKNGERVWGKGRGVWKKIAFAAVCVLGGGGLGPNTMHCMEAAIVEPVQSA